MGRRKIEIKQIKDDRNRSVTFLKRKGGLFKKAHELSVLCNVDVAVIIFGQNKKLYEYSSSDIGEIIQRHQFYGGANEHKGPSDFNGKGGDDEDDEDENSIPEDSHSQEPSIMAPQFAKQAAYQHMRQGPSASPPIPNGAQFAHVQRQLTPQPPMQMSSRPSSRNAPRMINSNLAQQHMQQPHPSPPVNGFTYMSQAPMYQGMPAHSQAPQQPSYQYQGPLPQQHQLQQVYLEEQRRSSMPPAFPQHERQNSGSINTPPISHHQLPSQQQQHQQQQQQQQQQQAQLHHQQQQQQQQQHQQQQHQQQQQQQQVQMHQQAQQEQQRQQQAYQQQQAQQMKQELPPPPQPQPQQQPAPQAQMLEPVKRMPVKSRSIFTPIDESRSILSQHWASSTTSTEATRPNEPQRSSSASSVTTVTAESSKAGTMKSPPKPGKRNISISSTATVSTGPPSSTFGPPSRTNSGLGGASGGKRPRLKVQIPDEASESEAGTGTNSPREGATAAETVNASQPQQPRRDGGITLPPPSPIGSRDENSILSAGATGPPNPFARPLPPQSNPSRESLGSRDGTMLPGSRDGDRMETPISALPSRFMTGDFLPSPNTFFSEWGMNGFRGGGGELPSPMNLFTPVVGAGPSFAREDSGSVRDSAGAPRPGTADMGMGGAKRKSPEEDERDEAAKKAKMEP